MVLERLDVVRAQDRARGFHVGGGHARGQHDEHAERIVLGRVEHVANAVEAEHVADLVRIGDDGGRAARHHGAREFRRWHHGRLDVHVRVDEAGRDDLARHVDRFVGGEARPHPYNPSVGNGNVGVVHLAGKYVDDLPALQQQIGGGISARNIDELTQFHSFLIVATETQKHGEKFYKTLCLRVSVASLAIDQLPGNLIVLLDHARHFDGEQLPIFDDDAPVDDGQIDALRGAEHQRRL